MKTRIVGCLQDKFLKEDSLVSRLPCLRERGHTILLANGVFDLCHPGHVALLHYAKTRPYFRKPYLIVAVNDDASAARLKGKGRPILTVAERALCLAGQAAVDAVVGFPEDTPERLIRALEPDVLVKGDEYRFQDTPGARFVVDRGGVVLWVPQHSDLHTSALVEHVRVLACRALGL